MVESVQASEARHIKLGWHGMWAQKCIEETNTLRLGFQEEDHAACLAGKWDAIKRQFLIQGHGPSKATSMKNEIKTFYEAGDGMLWITFYNNKMWVRRESRLFDCEARLDAVTTPAVPSAVAYRRVRCQQWRGAEPSRQCNPTMRSSGTLRSASCPASAKAGAVLGLVA
jgi:hypothetical protein